MTSLKGFLLAFFLCLLVTPAHCSVTVAPFRAESHIVEDWTTEAVLHGSAIAGKIMGDGNNSYTSVRFHVYGKALLYEETVLFCGDVSGSFLAAGQMEVVFDAVAYRMFQGVGCHNLKSVDNWSPPKKRR